MATGWTWEYIGQQMTLPRLYALYKHWANCPPVHESFAIYAGFYKPEAKPLPKVDNAWQLEKLMPEMNAETAHGVSHLPKLMMRMPARGG